jgi:hypothetical protein
VACLLKAERFQWTETAIARQQPCKRLPGYVTIAALICNRGTRHVRVCSDVMQQWESCRIPCCHVVRHQTESVALMEHVIPRHPHQERNGVFCCVRSWAISLDPTGHKLRPPEAHLTLNGRNISLASHVKYLGVIFDKRITWRQHIKMIEIKAFRTFITIYSLFTARKADVAAICELIFYKMWELQHLTTLWASTACYRDTFYILLPIQKWAIKRQH